VTTPRPGLDQILQAYTGAAAPAPAPMARVAAAAGLEVVLGRLADQLDQSRKLEHRLWTSAMMFPFPAQAYTMAGGVPVPPTFIADAHAPKDGYTWFATRLSVDGLVANGGVGQYQEASAAAPGAGATVLNIAAGNLTPGTYLVYWTVAVSGAAAAADANNMQISGPGTGGNKGAVFPGAAGEYPQDTFILNVPPGNGTALKVTAIGAATAGTVYSAAISLVPTPSDQVQLYRGPALAVGAQPQNRIHTFTAPNSTGPGPDWTPGGKGLLMNPKDALLLAGTGLAAAQLVLSGDVICIETALLPRYIL